MSIPKKCFVITHHIHYVYTGWMYFLDKRFTLDVYAKARNIDKFGKFHTLLPKRSFTTLSNFYQVYSQQDIDPAPGADDLVIIGDIFCNSLCLAYRGAQVIYYSEYFDYKKTWTKKLLGALFIRLFFRNKKILVPTQLAYQTFSRYSNHVVYFPSVYYGKVKQNTKHAYDEVHLLYVGRIDQQMKQVGFLLEQFVSLYEKFPQIRLTLVGKITDPSFEKDYGDLLQYPGVTYAGFVSHEQLEEIYTRHDIFVLPSAHDPIGQVVLEAMAAGNALVVSDTVGAGGYIMPGKNGEIFETSNGEQLQEKLALLISDSDRLKSYKQASSEHIQTYLFDNEGVEQDMRKKLERLL